jgi:hypothetical protein
LFAFVAVVAEVAELAIEAEVANEAVPVKFPTKVVEVTEVNPAIVVADDPNAIAVEPTVIELFAKLVFGIAAKPNVNVSVPALAAIVKPCPDEDAKFKDPVIESAIILTAPNEAVANPLACVMVPAVKYPASLFNCDTLLPDTTTFFQFAILFYLFFSLYFMLINIKFLIKPYKE